LKETLEKLREKEIGGNEFTQGTSDMMSLKK